MSTTKTKRTVAFADRPELPFTPFPRISFDFDLPAAPAKRDGPAPIDTAKPTVTILGKLKTATRRDPIRGLVMEPKERIYGMTRRQIVNLRRLSGLKRVDKVLDWWEAQIIAGSIKFIPAPRTKNRPTAA